MLLIRNAKENWAIDSEDMEREEICKELNIRINNTDRVLSCAYRIFGIDNKYDTRNSNHLNKENYVSCKELVCIRTQSNIYHLHIIRNQHMLT